MFNKSSLEKFKKCRTSLSERELQVCKYLYFSHKDIAKKLFISEATIKTHFCNIYSITYTQNKTQLLLYLLNEKILKLKDFIYERK